MQLRQSVLARELAAPRDLNLATHRLAGGQRDDGERDGPAGQLRRVAGRNTVPYARSETRTLQRAGYAGHHVWVTPFADLEDVVKVVPVP